MTTVASAPAYDIPLYQNPFLHCRRSLFVARCWRQWLHPSHSSVESNSNFLLLGRSVAFCSCVKPDWSHLWGMGCWYFELPGRRADPVVLFSAAWDGPEGPRSLFAVDLRGPCSHRGLRFLLAGWRLLSGCFRNPGSCWVREMPQEGGMRWSPISLLSHESYHGYVQFCSEKPFFEASIGRFCHLEIANPILWISPVLLMDHYRVPW